MKKLLALVLALVMTLSLCTISNAAYSDAADVSYNEAVDVMTAVGVFEGADGKFSPKENLTREQAAKLIAYLDLGKTVAEALPAVKVFDDVAADRWSSKFVAYCADAGYIAGVGDNKFDPAGQLTGYAFGKMLLCVLGYDASLEGFTGSSWTIKVAKLMESNDIADDVTTAASATLTREAAAQYCLNALQADMVSYSSKGTNITINGAVIATGASAAAPVAVKDEVYTADYTRKSGAASIGTKQLCEKLYSAAALTLYKNNDDVNGKSGYTWKVSKNGVISSAASFVAVETVIGSSYDATALYAASGKSLTRKDSTNAKYIAELATDCTYYVNGTQVTATSAAANTYWWDATNKQLKYGNPGSDVNGYGVLVELIDTNKDQTKAEKIYFTTYKVATVTKAATVKTNTVDGKDYVYLSLSGNNSIGVTGVTGENAVKASDVKGYEGLAKDDVVTVVKMHNGTYTVTKLDAVVGQVSASTSNSMTINGTATKFAKAADSTITSYNKGYAEDVNFFYDAYGYVVRAEAITAKTTNYLFVLDNQAYNDTFNTGVSGSNKSKVVFDDGVTAVITVAKVDSYSWAKDTLTAAEKPVQYDVYAYTKNDDGSYNLISKTETDGTAAITKGVSGTAKGNDNTKYIVRDKKANGTDYKTTWTAYTGYKNVPSIATEAAWYSVNNSTTGYADVVFIYTYGNVASTAKDVIYLLSTSATTVYDKDGAVDYYTMSAIVNGEKTVVKASYTDLTQYNSTSNTDGLSATATSVAAKNLFKVVYTDDELAGGSMTVATTSTEDVVEAATGEIKAAENGVVSIGGTSYNYAANAAVYVINSAADSVEILNMSNYDTDVTYSSIFVVTEALGESSPTALQKNTVTAIYLQK